MKILAIIPARGDSKSIPHKNIYPLAGKPLLAWTIEAALKSKTADRIVVSSDNDKILGVAKEFGAEPIKRPKKFARDNSPNGPLIFHALKYLKKNQNYSPDILIYLQPTSPLRQADDIKAAVSMLKPDVKAVISVYEYDNKFLKSFFIDRLGFLRGVSKDEFSFINRQSLPPIYMPNGAIEVIRTKDFLRTGKLFIAKSIAYCMPKEKSIDVDSFEDLKEIEKLLKKGIQKITHNYAYEK